MLTGRLPCTADSDTVMKMRHVQNVSPPLTASRRDLPAGVGAVVARALRKQPGDRFQTAGELSEALSRAASQTSDAVTSIIAPRVAQTVPNAPVDPVSDDLDEVTLVRPTDEVTVVRPGPVVQPRPASPAYVHPITEPAAMADINPWRVMIPAAIVLVAVFGIVFLLTRGTSQ